MHYPECAPPGLVELSQRRGPPLHPPRAAGPGRFREHPARHRGAAGHAARTRSAWSTPASAPEFTPVPDTPDAAPRFARATAWPGPFVLNVGHAGAAQEPPAPDPRLRRAGAATRPAAGPGRRQGLAVRGRLPREIAELGLQDRVVFPGFVAEPICPRCTRLPRRLRLPVAVRGLRPAGAGGHGLRHAGGLLQRLQPARGGRRCRPPGGSARRGRAGDGAGPGALRRDLRADLRAARARRRPARFTWPAAARPCWQPTGRSDAN